MTKSIDIFPFSVFSCSKTFTNLWYATLLNSIYNSSVSYIKFRNFYAQKQNEHNIRRRKNILATWRSTSRSRTQTRRRNQTRSDDFSPHYRCAKADLYQLGRLYLDSSRTRCQSRRSCQCPRFCRTGQGRSIASETAPGRSLGSGRISDTGRKLRHQRHRSQRLVS